MFLKKNFPDEAVSIFFLSESGAKNCHFVSLRLRSVKGEKGWFVQRSSGMECCCLCFHEDRMRLGSSKPKACFWLGTALAFRYLCDSLKYFI